MKTIDKRLDDLEQAAIERGKSGFKALYIYPDSEGYWENSPYKSDRGRHYTEDDKQALDGEIETLFIIEYVDDWRADADNDRINPEVA